MEDARAGLPLRDCENCGRGVGAANQVLSETVEGTWDTMVRVPRPVIRVFCSDECAEVYHAAKLLKCYGEEPSPKLLYHQRVEAAAKRLFVRTHTQKSVCASYDVKFPPDSITSDHVTVECRCGAAYTFSGQEIAAEMACGSTPSRTQEKW